MAELNVPVDFAKVTSEHPKDYARQTLAGVETLLATLKKQPSVTFDNVFGAMDDVYNRLYIASTNCYTLFWVSNDSATRANGYSAYQELDSMTTSISSDSAVYAKMTGFKSSGAYNALAGHRKLMVDDMIQRFERSGVNLKPADLQRFQALTKEINNLSADFSSNMNAAKVTLTLDEKSTAGLPADFKNNYKVSEGKYEIPVSGATRETFMSSAIEEESRKAFYMKFYNIAADKNLRILDSLVKKRYELAKIMGYNSFAAYNLVPKMAKDPQTVWAFLNNLKTTVEGKAKADYKELEELKKTDLKTASNVQLNPWDIGYYKNQLLKTKYQVDYEGLKDYFPMEDCLKGMLNMYQTLLGLEFRKVKDPSVWDKEVDMYEVYEDNKLKGRFYMDLYPRPNKETWFYGIPMVPGRATDKGYEIPVAMLLGNFSRPTKTQPSLLSLQELNTMFHEFGHIMNSMAWHGEFSSQFNSKDDFGEAMSQMFENWLWDYEMLSSISRHYKTGEKLPKDLFDKMQKAKNLSSGYGAMIQLRRCFYDMNLYDKYDPAAPVNTDKLWQDIDQQIGFPGLYVAGTHQQASWIHINTHPVYMYGYLWSEVYAQDMFSIFEKNGLLDPATGKRYRELILANGTQRDIVEAVDEFLGRKSDNKAYLKSLGLE
ncbi:MAG: M3 family metallopeptidase [Pseudobacter sp.]|uniref:M3 family metallopeptidase n=1 Tax=Pseudobacter sp. TaxID=2045420 RepID=UPI003F7D802F